MGEWYIRPSRSEGFSRSWWFDLAHVLRGNVRQTPLAADLIPDILTLFTIRDAIMDVAVDGCRFSKAPTGDVAAVRWWWLVLAVGIGGRQDSRIFGHSG